MCFHPAELDAALQLAMLLGGPNDELELPFSIETASLVGSAPRMAPPVIRLLLSLAEGAEGHVACHVHLRLCLPQPKLCHLSCLSLLHNLTLYGLMEQALHA